jgi:cytoskeleton protein RodZ
MANSGDGEMRIGEVLKRTRTRQGIDIAEVEERTKIRIKYLRALENEDWGVLPSPAYARGFLRTYAQLLGLDADAIVDEFRRQAEVEPDTALAYGFGEPVLEGRRRPGGPAPGRWRGGVLVAAGLVVTVVVLGVIGLVGGDDEGGGGGERKAKAERQERQRKRAHKEKQREQAPAAPPEEEKVTLRLVLNSDVQVCLLGAGDQPLIDDQLLSAGSEEGPYEAPSFELRFPFGYDREQFDLFLNGKPARVPEAQGASAYSITPPARLKPAEATESCP